MRKLALFVEELTPAQLTQVTPSLKPNDARKTSGYLRADEDLLGSVAQRNAALAKLGVTHAALAERISSLAHGDRLIAGVQVKESASRGIEPCPFATLGTRCPQTSVSFTFHNLVNDETIALPGLAAHRISVHHFFPGGARASLDPAHLVPLLQLDPSFVAAPTPTTADAAQASSAVAPQAAPSDWFSGLLGSAQRNHES